MEVCGGYNTKHLGIEIVYNERLELVCPLCKALEELEEARKNLSEKEDEFNMVKVRLNATSFDVTTTHPLTGFITPPIHL